MASISDPLLCPVCMYRFTSSGEHEPVEFGCGHNICRDCARRIFGEMNPAGNRCLNARQDGCRCPTCRTRVVKYLKNFTFASAVEEHNIQVRTLNSKHHKQLEKVNLLYLALMGMCLFIGVFMGKMQKW